MKPITISNYIKREKRQLINLRFQQLYQRGIKHSELMKILSDEFSLQRSSIYYYIDTREQH